MVEVGAGAGMLASYLNLTKDNYTDNYEWNDGGNKLFYDPTWVEAAEKVTKELGTDTILRFYNEGKKIDLLIIVMPNPGADAFVTALTLFHFYPEAKIFYIGPEDTLNGRFADGDFFDHLTEVDNNDDFYKCVVSNYPYKNITDFQKKYLEADIPEDIHPFLYTKEDGHYCKDENCLCKYTKEKFLTAVLRK